MDIDLSIFKSYDIRGTFPEQINSEIAYKIAQGFVSVFNPQGKVLVGNDVRIHSEEIKNALICIHIDLSLISVKYKKNPANKKLSMPMKFINQIFIGKWKVKGKRVKSRTRNMRCSLCCKVKFDYMELRGFDLKFIPN